jgi:putative transposase
LSDLGNSRDSVGTQVALFRYGIIRQVEDEGLSKMQRGRLVQHIAGQQHMGVDGRLMTVSRETIDRWSRLWRKGGFDALRPTERNIAPRTNPELLALAFALKKERPERTAAQVAAIIKSVKGDGPAERTIQFHFAKEGLNKPVRITEQFGRFEAGNSNDRWTGDALHGPLVNGKKAILFAYEDDHSRVITGYRWVRREDTVRAESALRPAFESRGIPKTLYLDNGSPFVDLQLRQTLAKLGVRLIHSTPGRPAGRGKIERFFRTVRDQFLVEIDDNAISSMDELNQLFTAWVETVYHTRVHGETKQSPLDRWEASWATAAERGMVGIKFASPAELNHAFLWSEERLVTKTATISLLGNKYEVAAHLAGRKVEVRFDPFNMDDLDVYVAGVHQGKASPHEIRVHVHPKARPDETTIVVAETGVSYLSIVKAAHEQKLAEPVSFTNLLGGAVNPNENGKDA